MHLHVARELVSERRRLRLTPLFNHLIFPKTTTHRTRSFYFLFGLFTPGASQQVCFIFHLLNFFSFMRKQQAHAALSTQFNPPTHTHTRLVAPEAHAMFGLRQLIYFLEEA